VSSDAVVALAAGVMKPSSAPGGSRLCDKVTMHSHEGGNPAAQQWVVVNR
jgi:hypothetical protein